MDLKNKAILITGAGAGIGYELSQILAEKGAKVICFDVNIPEEKIDKVKYFKVNITSSENIKDALAKIDGKIDILINNAGVMRRGNILEIDEKDYDFLFDVNLKGSWLMTKHAAEYLSKNATIAFMSSRHGYEPAIDPAIYSLTKSAMITMASLIEKTYPNLSIKIMCPGPTDTAVCRYGVEGKALEEKKKIMCHPLDVAKKIVDLLESDKKKLLFDQKKWDYYFE